MGWSFRRSARLGPLRVNFSKSGVGWSLGGRGFRIGKDAKGRTYSQTSIPGTGIYNRTYYPNKPTTQSSGPPQQTAPKVALPNAAQQTGFGLRLSPQVFLWTAVAVLAIIYYIVRSR
jgi:hypothetical protein